MFNTSKLHELHGQAGELRCDDLHFAVKILDSRQVFNRVDCLVEPINGSGQQWVSVERLREPRATTITDNLVEPIAKPTISGNLIDDPRLAGVLAAPR